MSDEPGFFQFEITQGATGMAQANWALVTDDGDIVAISSADSGVKSARAQVQWIIDNASKCRVVEPPGFFPSK